MLELLNACIQLPLAFLYVFILVDDWRFSKRTVRLTVLFMLIALIPLIILILTRYGFSPYGKTVVSAATIIICLSVILILSKYGKGRILFVFFCAVSFNLMGAAFSEVIGSTSSEERLIVKLFVQLLVFTLILLLFRKIILTLLREIDQGWHKLTVIPFAFTCVLLLLLVSERLYDDFELKLIALAVCSTMCFVYGMVYHLFLNLRGQYLLKKNYELLQTQVSSIQKHSETIRHQHQELKILRHDLRHYIQIQASCLESGDVESARHVVNAMGNHLEQIWLSSTGQAYTSDLLINDVISYYLLKAEAAEIAFEIKMSLPDKLSINTAELAVAIANALENAVNACEKLPKDRKRAIKLSGHSVNQQFLLEISNTYAEPIKFNQEGTMPISEREGHGYGSQSIAAFADKYGGVIDYQLEDCWFQLKILF